ncbi:MAG: thioredoxin [Pirellulales bacterium]|nr:thioredoxin [Pirellulales bacterium]
MATVRQHSGKVQHANEDTFSREVLGSNVPVLVDFYADWCGPCQRLAPTLEELARDTPDAKVVKVNVDHSPRLAARYGVDSIPSVKVFKNGEVVAEHVGLASKLQLLDLLRR